jgi:hypothetical protein
MASDFQLKTPVWSTPYAPKFGDLDLQAPNVEVGTSIAASNFATPSAAPVADYSGVAGAGISAAGQAASTIAQIAAQQNALKSAAGQNSANAALSERLAKASLAQNRDQFEKNRELQNMMWALSANDNSRTTSNAARDVRRQDEQMMSDLLARIYLR